MSPKTTTSDQLVIILGAGASRSVSYASTREYPSFLDRDFFDLLQRWREDNQADKHAGKIGEVLDWVRSLPHDCWRSMEKAFYTLHLRALLADRLGHTPPIESEGTVVGNFALSVETLLRAAHDKEVCQSHKSLLSIVTPRDTIISFNYDLVVERAIRKQLEKENRNFGPWIYALEDNGSSPSGPRLLKLHGSANWIINDENLAVRTQSWNDFDNAPGYRASGGSGTEFPIFLPFWDKRIENQPWLSLWSAAYQALSSATRIIVWGYSLPTTDIKAQQLFSLSLASKKKLKFCVIDPSSETRERWRQLVRDASYWEYSSIEDFLAKRPKWG